MKPTIKKLITAIFYMAGALVLGTFAYVVIAMLIFDISSDGFAKSLSVIALISIAAFVPYFVWYFKRKKRTSLPFLIPLITGLLLSAAGFIVSIILVTSEGNIIAASAFTACTIAGQCLTYKLGGF